MLDKISYNILEELCQEGRISNAELARTFGISEVTATKKINSLIENNIIVIKAMPNSHLMGYHQRANQHLYGLFLNHRKIVYNPGIGNLL